MVDKTTIESQLHDQYAINNNEHLSALIMMLGSISAIVGSYGYVFVHTAAEKFEPADMFLENGSVLFRVNTLLLTGSAVIGLLFALVWICLELGTGRRKDQFITFAIRCKAYKGAAQNGEGFNVQEGRQPDFSKGDVFPIDYHPFNKGSHYCIGLFGILVSIFNWLYLVIVAATLWRTWSTWSWNTSHWIFVIVATAYLIGVLLEAVIVWCCGLAGKEKYSGIGHLLNLILCEISPVWSSYSKYRRYERDFKSFRPGQSLHDEVHSGPDATKSSGEAERT